MKERPDFYVILGLGNQMGDWSQDEIKAAYRTRVKECHPDTDSPDTEEFHQVQQAYEVLSDPERRKLYDEGGDWTGELAAAKKTAAEIFVGIAEGEFLATVTEIHATACRKVGDHIKMATDSQHNRRTAAHRLARAAGGFPPDSALRKALIVRAAMLETEADRQQTDIDAAKMVLACLQSDSPLGRQNPMLSYWLQT